MGAGPVGLHRGAPYGSTARPLIYSGTATRIPQTAGPFPPGPHVSRIGRATPASGGKVSRTARPRTCIDSEPRGLDE